MNTTNPSTNTHKVIIYSTPTCPFCIYAKEFFKENNVPFEDIDVTKDHVKAQEMVQKSGQMGVPVISIGDEVVVGFNEPRLAELLEIK